MRVLAIEDDKDKSSALEGIAKAIEGNAIFDVCSDISSVFSKLQSTKYDLIILDLMLPMVTGSVPADVSEEFVNIISDSKLNRFTNIIALTAYEELFRGHQKAFVEAGVFLVHYDVSSDAWEATVRSLLKRSAAQPRADFLVVCALEVERNAFEKTRAIMATPTTENGFDVRRMRIGEHVGSAILLPRTGLVNAAAITAAAIERYHPKLIATSGICAGIRSRSVLGQVLVCDTCWEYQVGKYTAAGFQFEPYQTKIPETVRQKLASVCRSEELAELIYGSKMPPGVEPSTPKIATIVSGSSVIASAEMREKICKQHRKIDGVEMELSAIFRAVDLLDSSITVIAAKGVADFGDEEKDDHIQEFAASAASCFLVEAIDSLLT